MAQNKLFTAKSIQHCRSKAGMSLASVIVSIALMSIIGMGLVKMTRFGQKATNTVSKSVDAELFKSEMMTVLTNEKSCTPVLKDLPFNPDQPKAMPVNFLLYPHDLDGPRIKAGEVFGKVRIKSVTLKPSTILDSDRSQVQLTYELEGMNNEILGPAQLKPVTLTLTVAHAGGKITDCGKVVVGNVQPVTLRTGMVNGCRKGRQPAGGPLETNFDPGSLPPGEFGEFELRAGVEVRKQSNCNIRCRMTVLRAAGGSAAVLNNPVTCDAYPGNEDTKGQKVENYKDPKKPGWNYVKLYKISKDENDTKDEFKVQP